jgi:hypothetical protein
MHGALEYIEGGRKTISLAYSITLLYSLRLAAWYAVLFSDEE